MTLLEAGTGLPKNCTPSEAIALFDSLDPVDLDFMIGRWKGYEVSTGHPMDGLLDLANWYGKEFVSPDCVHPLLFSGSNGEVFKVAPNPQM
ncbi:MAG: GXWXG domain-containing protein, partial [Phormidesmis sp.]